LKDVRNVVRKADIAGIGLPEISDKNWLFCCAAPTVIIGVQSDIAVPTAAPNEEFHHRWERSDQIDAPRPLREAKAGLQNNPSD
jgi:hypothetical protein